MLQPFSLLTISCGTFGRCEPHYASSIWTPDRAEGANIELECSWKCKEEEKTAQSTRQTSSVKPIGRQRVTTNSKRAAVEPGILHQDMRDKLKGGWYASSSKHSPCERNRTMYRSRSLCQQRRLTFFQSSFPLLFSRVLIRSMSRKHLHALQRISKQSDSGARKVYSAIPN